MRSPGRRPAVALTALIVAVLTVVVLSGPGSAQSQDDEFAAAKIDVIGQVPWDAGRLVDAQVTVTSERAISGTLSIVDTPEGRSTTTFEFDIDLAANTSAVFPITLTTGWEGVEASAVVRSSGDVVAEDEVRQFGEGGSEGGTVAVLGIDSPPQRVPEVGGENQLATLALDRQLRGLERVSSLLTTPGAIRELGSDSSELLRVNAWIQGGGQLVVDGPPRSLDDSYHRYPTANPARFGLGAGSVVYIDEWETDGVPLGGYLGVEGLRQLVETQQLGTGSAGELAILANIALPGVALVGGVLLVYTLLAGPVVFGFLSAKRAQRRIWVILPLLSLVFATGILGVGFATRSGRTEAHITIVEVNERGSRATSNLLLTSSFGGNRQIDTPEGWSYLGQGRTNGQRPVQLRIGSSSTEISLDMPPGSNAVARLAGVATEFDGMLTIDNVRADGDEITAEVSNNGDADLVEGVAFLGNARRHVGAIAAGERVTFSIDAHDATGRTMKELLLWPRVGQEWGNNGPIAVPRDREAKTAAGAWTEWRISQGTSASPENVLGVVAWSDELDGPVAGISEGRTALFARTDVSGVRSGTGFTTVSRLPTHQQPIFDGNFAGFVEDYRVTLSEGYDLDRLAIKASAESSALSLLTDDGWVHIDLPAGGAAATFAIPAEAVLDGELRLRSYVPEWVFGVGATALIVVDPEETATAKLVTELSFRDAGDGRRGGPAEFEERFGPDGGIGPRGLVEEASTALPELKPDEPYTESGSLSAGSHHSFTITLAEDQSLVVTMQSGEDSYLELLDDSGELLSSNDDYGRGVDSQIQFTAPMAGEYEVRAMELGSNSISYDITVVVSE